MEKKTKKVFIDSTIIFVFFLAIGIILWQTQGHIFFLFNFIYIGIAGSTGELLFGILPREKKHWGRKLTQLLIGLYMLGVLGFLSRENMQIEGFFIYLMAGIFSGPVIHYLIAKVGGTFIFGRAWCGFQITDLYKYAFHELNWIIVIVGNLLYFAVAIILAAGLKDNRAFCKYVCPIPVLMKIGARFSIWKIEIEKDSCIDCGLCEKNCPMNIKLLTYMKNNQRVLSTECIGCQQCVNICPEKIISYTKKLDTGFKEYLNFENNNAKNQ